MYNQAMKDNVFQVEYSRLNAQQKEAVDTIEGPVMVVAGPGTGKTQVLTMRIANIMLKTHVTSANILAITFTNNAATNMKERLSRIIGSQAYATNIFTFHGFCQHLIDVNPDDFWSLLGSRLADDIEKVRVLEQIIDHERFTYIRPYNKPYLYLKSALDAISNLKREGVSPEEFANFVEQEQRSFDATPDKENKKTGTLKTTFHDWRRNINKNRELAVLYDLYQKKMASDRRYDYDDLIMHVLKKLEEDRDFRLRQMEQYQYVLVDEHQDSNNAQNKILSVLLSFHENPNIFVVGDEKQAIYRFQGASIENFRSFTQRYPNAKLITLRNNYRSSQTILDCALALLEGSENHGLLACAKRENTPITIIDSPDVVTSMLALTKRVTQDIASGVPPHEIAILVRTNQQIQSVMKYLRLAKIPVYSNAQQNIFETETIERFMRLFRAIHMYGDGNVLFRALTLEIFQIDALTLYTVTQAAQKRRKELVELLCDGKVLRNIVPSSADKLTQIMKSISEWALRAHNENVHTLFHSVVKSSGFLDYLLRSENPLVTIAPLRVLYDTIAAVDPDASWKLADFFAYYEKLVEHTIPVPVRLTIVPEGKVQILTVHSAKGLEYDHVYIPFAQDTIWGGRERPELFRLPDAVYGATKGSVSDDSRRLFFVALTRARKQVSILYAHHDPEGKRILPTEYIADIQPTLVRHEHETATEEATLETILANERTDDKEVFREFVRGTFYHYGVSVSALNNYTACPWRYFYVNLVRVPQGKDISRLFGDAVHNALSYFFSHYKETGDKSLLYLMEACEKACEREPFGKEELERNLARGKEILKAYYDTYEATFSRTIRVKQRIPKVALLNKKFTVTNAQRDTLKPGIPLNGEFDLVEYLDATNTQVLIRDFKTGKPKSRNEILGKTQNADGNYYRQLVFYKLLLRLHNPRLRMKYGEIDFVQPDERGRFHRERFEIPDEEVQQLEEDIFVMADDVLNLKFWNRECGDGECEWCRVRRELSPRQFGNGLF
jgi:DNA helicase-2/ATP-dependent DNA helicase PcrA